MVGPYVVHDKVVSKYCNIVAIVEPLLNRTFEKHFYF